MLFLVLCKMCTEHLGTSIHTR